MLQEADSRLKCERWTMQLYLLRKYFMWCSVAEAFPGSVVEAMRGQFHIPCCDEFECHLLGNEMANQPVHFLVGIALPKGIRIGKEEVCPKLFSNTLILGERQGRCPLSVVRCQGSLEQASVAVVRCDLFRRCPELHSYAIHIGREQCIKLP
jgi:hypothetical protein